MIASLTGVPVVGVTRLSNFISKMFNRERRFARLGVRGEITNYRLQPNGNVYFDLKERDVVLNCVAFSAASASFPALTNGEQIVAYGTVQTYEPKSSYQLRVFAVVAEGARGALHQRYEALRARLAAEGLFAPERRRPLPRYPFRVALVTSRTAEGARDFVTQAQARAPQVAIRLVETPVQGEHAAPEIARAIARASAMRDVDLIVVARGGGSFEDLFAFSDERVVRALARSPIPTVSAIGHEGDVQLTDLVADQRAATPSAAAQLLPKRDDLLQQLAALRRAVERDVERAVAIRRQRVDGARRQLVAAARQRAGALRDRLARIERRLAAVDPAARLAERRARFQELRDRLTRTAPSAMRRRAERLDGVAARLRRAEPSARIARSGGAIAVQRTHLDSAMARLIERGRAQLQRLEASLAGNNPEAILQRGYAIVTDEAGRTLRDTADAPPGSRIMAQLARGTLAARVEAEGSDGGRQIDLF